MELEDVVISNRLRKRASLIVDIAAVAVADDGGASEVAAAVMRCLFVSSVQRLSWRTASFAFHKNPNTFTTDFN